MSLHIVHLEDDGPLREILRISLQHISSDVTMHQFIDSDSTVNHITENLKDVDLCILDIRVPGQWNGIEVAEKIRELGTEVPIVLTSAYRKPENSTLQSLGCEWYPKPWHILETADKMVKMARIQRNAVKTNHAPTPDQPAAADQADAPIPDHSVATNQGHAPTPDQPVATDQGNALIPDQPVASDWQHPTSC